jgi:tetratricopeptide (TPR) repeat protein
VTCSFYIFSRFILAMLCTLLLVNAASATDFFKAGNEAYKAGDYGPAAQAFRKAVALQPSSGALQNLGNAEWQRGRAGDAILAWEQALWVNPFDGNARNNLRFARESAQLESPELTWYEIASAWLPVNCWAWIAGISLWSAVGALVLPGVFRWRKAAWPQAVAALGLGLFLVSIPAHAGALRRSNVGFVLKADTPLRLTPTSGAEVLTRLAAGEPARRVRTRGNYVFVRTNRSSGWIEKSQLGLICTKGRPERSRR